MPLTSPRRPPATGTNRGCAPRVARKAMRHVPAGTVLPVLWYYPRNLPALGHISHDTDNNIIPLGENMLRIVNDLGIHTTWCVIVPGYPPALYDAIRMTALPTIELHISNPDAREPFRHVSTIAAAVRARVCGFGPQSYDVALDGLLALLAAATKRAGAPASRKRAPRGRSNRRPR